METKKGDTKRSTQIGSFYRSLLPLSRGSAQKGLWRALEMRRARLASQGKIEVEIQAHRTHETKVINRFCGLEVPSHYRVIHKTSDGKAESYVIPNNDEAPAETGQFREPGWDLPDPWTPPKALENERARLAIADARDRQYEGWFGPLQRVTLRHPAQSNAGIPLDIDVFALIKGTKLFTIVTSGLTDPPPVAGLPEGIAGRGYELLIQTTTISPWCFGLIEFLVQREIEEPGGLLRLLLTKHYLTMPALATSDLKTTRPVLLGAPIPRMPEGWTLPNGKARFVALTALHPEELAFSKKLGVEELVALLSGAGIYHMTDLERPPAAKG